MVLVAAHGQMDKSVANHSPKPEVADAAGNLHVPESYRTTYQLLGSWGVAANQGQGLEELHVVYVLVKEVFKAATGKMTTGTVSHADNLKGWFVMVKESSDRHPDNQLWGDGWGICM